MIKAGTTFTVCSHEELVKKGWYASPFSGNYFHDDFPGNTITSYMIDGNEGKILTVDYLIKLDWYCVKENTHYWPVVIFLDRIWEQVNLSKSSHICEEGMTAIDGWAICKHCGTNLREIK